MIITVAQMATGIAIYISGYIHKPRNGSCALTWQHAFHGVPKCFVDVILYRGLRIACWDAIRLHNTLGAVGLRSSMFVYAFNCSYYHTEVDRVHCSCRFRCGND